MNTQHKKNLIELALHLLKNERDGYIKHGKLKVKFDMWNWMTDRKGHALTSNEVSLCETSCCAAGDWALLHPDRAVKYKGFTTFIQNDFGLDWTDGKGDYIFGTHNTNCVKSFARRCIQVLFADDYKNYECILNDKRKLISKLTSLRNGLD